MKYTISRKGNYSIFHIEGDVESDTQAKPLTEEITRLAEEGENRICFDLGQATYLNSSGVSIFIHALAEMEHTEGLVCMIVADSQVRDVVELAGLDKLMKVYSNMQDFEKAEF